MTTTTSPSTQAHKHERTYTILLAIFAFLLTLGVVSILLIANSPVIPQEERFFIRVTAYMEGCYAAAALLTLVLRLVEARNVTLVTKALNIVLLTFFPLGTALGVYGLWKLREVPATNQS